MFATDPEDQGSIPCRVTQKTQKMVLDVSLLNTQHLQVQSKGKWINTRKEVAPSPIPWYITY